MGALLQCTDLHKQGFTGAAIPDSVGEFICEKLGPRVAKECESLYWHFLPGLRYADVPLEYIAHIADFGPRNGISRRKLMAMLEGQDTAGLVSAYVQVTLSRTALPE